MNSETSANSAKSILTKEISETRARLLLEQKGICPICSRMITDPNLDHDHVTGAVRDVLCRNCNRVEGKILHWCKTVPMAKVDLLKALIKYWNRHKTNRHGLIHPGKRVGKRKRRTRK